MCDAATKTWKVRVPNRVRPWITVEAAWFTLDHGHLCFRKPGRNYPQAVHVFAPGQWLEVKDAQTS